MADRLKSFNKDQMAFLQRYFTPMNALFKMADSKEFTALFGNMTLGQVVDTFRDNLRAENAELKEEVQRWEGEGGSPN